MFKSTLGLVQIAYLVRFVTSNGREGWYGRTDGWRNEQNIRMVRGREQKEEGGGFTARFVTFNGGGMIVSGE